MNISLIHKFKKGRSARLTRHSSCFAAILMTAFLVVDCKQDDNNNQDALFVLLGSGQAGQPNQIADIPQPGNNMMTAYLGAESFSIPLGDPCKDISEQPELGYYAIAGNRPAMYLRGVDFSQVTLSISFDFDAPAVTYSPPAGQTCAAKIFENSATHYDIQILNCDVLAFLNQAPPNVVSLRARCEKT